MMSILIKDRKMPENCHECFCLNDEYFYCQAVGRKPSDDNLRNTRPDWCPLIEIQPHGRLIDADEISEHKYVTIPPHRKEYADGKPKSDKEIIAFKFGWNNAIDAITDNAPTIIPAEEE